MSYNLNDLSAAAASEGVNLIPFPDLRGDATSISDQVNRKKEDMQREGDMDPFIQQKKNLLSEIKEYKGKIESEQKDGFPRKEKIEEYEKEINDRNARIKDINLRMQSALDSAAALITARAMLREYFSKALSQLSDLSSNPERALGSTPSDDDKKKLED